MNRESFEKAMLLLDIIENELDKIAVLSGHKTFEEWKKEREL